MAFAKPDIKGKEIEIATAFYVKRGQEAGSRRAAGARRLVNNDKADVLATAYAPAEAGLCQGLAVRERC